ncbi:mannose-6-phosphate isomerase [Leifsonia sp. Root227]|uniref:mannose-6-phosphate isomerase, class I n=1 Tax=unclassified Leifsonia TaxID=2663824 RepID=UPI0006F76771|nr:mannose-6-phosphate isomerase, class I [Leifsonia sp. Root227]KRC52240.1 mannose-6-phosphate isomerase [Leifsonia sp. Root227]
MFVRIGNTPRDYAWGSTTAIAGLLGTTPSGKPEAELWLGAHPGSPSVIADPSQTGGAADLAAWTAADPQTSLGQPDAHLPYLLKVLAAAGPLSLQAHPSSAQAAEGFARENAAGIPLDSPERNYKDPFHKPELIYALSDTFDALCGFRDVARSAAIFSALAETAADGEQAVISAFAATLTGEPTAVLRAATEWLLGGDHSVGELVGAVVATAIAIEPDPAGDDLAVAADTVRMLAEAFPGDPGIVLALLLNRATLRPGEVLYLPAGNIHAYLRGLGIELMAASDNVLRGGLTPKRIDVPELMSILDFRPIVATPMAAEHPAPGVDVFRPDVPDFALDHVTVGAATPSTRIPLPGAGIAICTAGSVQLAGEHDGLTLARGESVFITPDEAAVTVSGDGTVFVATPNA